MLKPNESQQNIQWYLGENLFKLAWIGPYFPQSAPKSAEKMSELQRVFQEHNILRELVDNWKDGLISEPFTWYLKDKTGQRVDAAEAEIALQRWLDWINQQAIEADPESTNFKVSDVWTEFVLSLGVTGEGNLRLWQPEEFADDPDPIHQIHLHSPTVGSVAVDRNKNGFIEKITYTYGEGQREIQTRDRGFVVVAIENQQSEKHEELRVNSENRWLIQQVRKPTLLTPSSKKKMAAICHALTMKLRNQEIGGFKERTLINAEFPEEETQRGPGIDSYIYGIPQGDPSNPTYSTPSVHESQPVEIRTFLESIQLDRSLLYLEHKQGHLLSAGDGGLSGVSRIQLRQGFELHLRGWKRPIESAIGNILNIVLRILGYSNLEAVVELKITTGKLSAEEKNQIITEYQAGLISRTTAIAKLGTVGDVDAELALMAEELAEATATQPIADEMNEPFEPLDEDEE